LAVAVLLISTPSYRSIGMRVGYSPVEKLDSE
jgi:hypothetical protein